MSPRTLQDDDCHWTVGGLGPGPVALSQWLYSDLGCNMSGVPLQHLSHPHIPPHSPLPIFCTVANILHIMSDIIF